MPLYPRPDSFTPLAIPFSFLVRASPEQCVERLTAKTKTTMNWDQAGPCANWEQLDVNTWRVYLQEISRWVDLRSICYLERASPQSTRVSGYSEGNRRYFFWGSLVVVLLFFLIAIFMIVIYRDWSWLELPIIPLVIALFIFTNQWC